MKFRLLQGAHVQSHPDGLDSASLKDLRQLAVEDGMAKDQLETLNKESILLYLRRHHWEMYPDGKLPNGGMMRRDGSIHYHATLTHKPIFEEDNEAAIAVLIQDQNKYQRADATPEQMVGMTNEDLMTELKRRGIAPAGSGLTPTNQAQQLLDERFNNLESLTIADLRKVADDNEIDLTGNDGKPLTRKDEIITAIRNAAVEYVR